MVVLRAMAYDPDERYATAAEFADDLEHLLSREPQRPTGSALAEYLRSSFGEERYAEKTRIPTITTLKESGFSVPVTLPGASLMPSGSMPSVASEVRTGVVPPPPGTNGALAGGSRWRGIAVGVVASCLMLAGGAFVVGRKMAPPPQPVVQAAPPQNPVSPPVPVEPAPAAAPETAAPGSAVAAVAEAPPPAQTALAAAPEPTEVPPAEQAEPPVAKTAARTPVKRVTLEAADIQQVVSRNRARIMSCFEQYKRELPADEGQVQVRFTIFSSGKADAATQGALAAKPVGKCLEKQVERLRFPPHRDKEVTVVLPFGYRVTR